MKRKHDTNAYRRMQGYNCKTKCKNHGHDNEEDIQATVIARGIEPDKQNSWECKSHKIAYDWYCK